jgi:IrrE N-terminal-like domain
MTVVVCSTCGHRTALRSRFELDGECPECGGEEALVPEDAYDPEPLELICVDCRAQLEGGPAGSSRTDSDHHGRYTVEDACPFCSIEGEHGELVPLEDFTAPRSQPEAPLARAAARKLWLEHGGEIPVDVVAIAGAAGLSVKVGMYTHAGQLRDNNIIEVPADQPNTRRRFTIAHELGHATLRHTVAHDKLEIEANAFAAELLLPREKLREAVDQGLGFKAIAERFQASREATLYALKAANLLPKLAR